MKKISPDSRVKFEFGRHETFALRESWLTKGLSRSYEFNGFNPDLETADSLGLGSRMAKSLSFWLDATGMLGTSEVKKKADSLTDLGLTVLANDPYLEFTTTWWIIHVVLARRSGSVWNWFFNDFREREFERSLCIESFERHIREHAAKQTTTVVIQREIACLLQTYARPGSSEVVDPEDATYSPLRSLSLIIKHADTGRFERTRPLDQVPLEAFLTCVSALAEDTDASDVPLTALQSKRNGPGRVFGLDGDAVFELAAASSNAYSKEGVSLKTLGADRYLQVPKDSPAVWLERYFKRIGVVR